MAGESEVVSTLYGHCVQAYNIMYSESEYDKNSDMRIWEGMLTALITKQMNLSTPYYSSITKTLKAMGCIVQLRRGGGTAASTWRLMKAPSLEAFTDAGTVGRMNRPSKQMMLQEQVNALNNKVGELTNAVEVIVKWIQRFEESQKKEEAETDE